MALGGLMVFPVGVRWFKIVSDGVRCFQMAVDGFIVVPVGF